MDTAKLAWLAVGTDTSQLVTVPCGREPWRSFAPFAVLLDGAGGQDTTVDARLGGQEVVIDDALLAEMSDDVLLLTALDMLVAAIESLLTRKRQPFARSVATAAATELITAVEAALAGVHLDATAVMMASALSVEAFTSTGLGLAHGISTNLAAILRVPQDRINVLAGRWVLDRWENRPELEALRRTAKIDSPDSSISDLLAACRARLQIGTLSEEGVVEDDVDVVVPRIGDSSGIPWLPEPLGISTIRDVVRSLCRMDEKDARARLG